MSAEQIDAEKLGEALEYYGNGRSGVDGRMAYIFMAARAHLSTLPRVKEVEVWRVEYSEFCAVLNDGEWVPRTRTFLNHRSAVDFATDQDGCMSCITVTGPHKQKVPA